MKQINRNGHASLATEGYKSRIRKAQQVFKRISASEVGSKLGSKSVIMEIGCGSGHLLIEMAKSFPKSEIVGADIANRLQVDLTSNIHFVEINQSNYYGLESDKFDLIILNQVFEHIEPSEKKILLSEINRMLKDDGKVWFAAPNKYALVEPHFYIPLLSILPRRIADILVRFFKLGESYDCYPVSAKEFKNLLEMHFYCVENETIGTILFLSGMRSKIRRSKRVGTFFSNFSPTLVFTGEGVRK